MDEKEVRQRVIDILKEHNIKMSVMGCGCCGSPQVYFKYHDEVIADGIYGFNFDTSDSAKDSWVITI